MRSRHDVYKKLDPNYPLPSSDRTRHTYFFNIEGQDDNLLTPARKHFDIQVTMHISAILIAASCLTTSFAYPGDTDHEAQGFRRRASALIQLEQWIPDPKRTINADHETTLEVSQRKAHRLAPRAAGRGFGPPPNNRPGRGQPKQPESREARIARENQKISDLMKEAAFRTPMIRCLELNVFDDPAGNLVRLSMGLYWSNVAKLTLKIASEGRYSSSRLEQLYRPVELSREPQVGPRTS